MLHRERAVQKPPQAEEQQSRDLTPGDLAPSMGRVFLSTSMLSLAPLWDIIPDSTGGGKPTQEDSTRHQYPR